MRTPAPSPRAATRAAPRPPHRTFAEACETVIAIHAGNWKRGGRTEESWRATLRDYALPRLGAMPVDAIAGADVMAVLLPIWFTKRNTARNVRQRIDAVMKWAVAQGHRPDNPAGDALSAALPNNAGPRRHQRALPHAEVGDALPRVRASGAHPGTVLAFEFLVLTAARSGEVRNAHWEEFGLEGAVWTIPAARMKAGREHRVPLSARALGVLDEARRLPPGAGTVFPSPTGRTQISTSTARRRRLRNCGGVLSWFQTRCRSSPRAR